MFGLGPADLVSDLGQSRLSQLSNSRVAVMYAAIDRFSATSSVAKKVF